MSKLERLTKYRILKGYRTARAFAEYLGITANQISEIDKKEKPLTLLHALESKTDINIEWLNEGVGDMCIRKDASVVVGSAMPFPSTRRIPVISWVKAGINGFYEDAYPIGSGFTDIDCPNDVTDANAYAVEISGDSMSPKYESGDYVIVSPSRGVQIGNDAIVKLRDGQIMAKRIKSKNDHLILKSLNPEEQDIVVCPEDVVYMHRIVWVKPRG